MLENFGPGNLMKRIAEKLGSTDPTIVGGTLYVLCNIASGCEKQKALVMDPRVVERLSGFLVQTLVCGMRTIPV